MFNYPKMIDKTKFLTKKLKRRIKTTWQERRYETFNHKALKLIHSQEMYESLCYDQTIFLKSKK
jgi:hypothetical protein